MLSCKLVDVNLKPSGVFSIGGDSDAGEVAEVLQRAERSSTRQTVGYRAFQHDSRSHCSGVADYPDEGADA